MKNKSLVAVADSQSCIRLFIANLETGILLTSVYSICIARMNTVDKWISRFFLEQEKKNSLGVIFWSISCSDLIHTQG